VASFPYFNGTGSVYVVSVNGRNNEAWAHTTMLASLVRRLTDTNVYLTGYVEIWKTRHKISVDIRILFSLQSRPMSYVQYVAVLYKKLEIRGKA